MTEIVVGKEALLHLLKMNGIVWTLEEPPAWEVHGVIESPHGMMTFRYPDKRRGE